MHEKPETATSVKIALIEKSMDYVKSRYGEFLKLENNPESKYKCHISYNKDEFYLLLILKSKTGKIRAYRVAYDFVFAFTSENEETNKKAERDFHNATEIKLKEAPKILEDRLQNLNLVFKDFKEQNPDAVKTLSSLLSASGF